jgi:hypothetical protein
VLSFLGDHFLENRDAWFVAKRLQLLSTLGNVTTLVDLQAA